MRTERYDIALSKGLIGTGNKEIELLKEIVLDFFKLKREDAEKQFGNKSHDGYINHTEFMYGLSYSRISNDDLVFYRKNDDIIEMIIYNDDTYISTSSSMCYALNCLLKKMIDETVSVTYLNPEFELVLLGPVKQPDYCHETDWFDEDSERVTKYHITDAVDGRTNYHVGDSFLHGSHLEVYGSHLFYDESEIDEYLQDKYPEAKQYDY